MRLIHTAVFAGNLFSRYPQTCQCQRKKKNKAIRNENPSHNATYLLPESSQLFSITRWNRRHDLKNLSCDLSGISMKSNPNIDGLRFPIWRSWKFHYQYQFDIISNSKTGLARFLWIHQAVQPDSGAACRHHDCGDHQRHRGQQSPVAAAGRTDPLLLDAREQIRSQHLDRIYPETVNLLISAKIDSLTNNYKTKETHFITQVSAIFLFEKMP